MFTILLPIVDNRRVALEALLRATAADELFHFSAVASLHFASMTIHDDARSGSKLIFELNGEGRADALLVKLVAGCGPSLRPVFAMCQGWTGTAEDDDSMVAFLRSRVQWPAARHVGNTGRTLAQIRREAELHDRLGTTLDTLQADGVTFYLPADVRARLTAPSDEDGVGYSSATHHRVARLTVGERIRRIAPLILALLLLPLVFGIIVRAGGWGTAAAVLAASLLAALTLVTAGAGVLRYKERRDPVSIARPGRAQLESVQRFEDRTGVQNHLASIIAVKPGPFRSTVLRLVLFVINQAARLIYTKGRLGRLSSIHFAHWSIIDGGRNLLFLSNFDGSWESYLDDFIEKAHTGLTAVWSNGIGFPRTRWLIRNGASDGEAFKAWARISQLPSLVWYQAYPTHSVQDIDQSSLLADGLHATLTTKEEQAWTRAV